MTISLWWVSLCLHLVLKGLIGSGSALLLWIGWFVGELMLSYWYIFLCWCFWHCNYLYHIDSMSLYMSHVHFSLFHCDISSLLENIFYVLQSLIKGVPDFCPLQNHYCLWPMPLSGAARLVCELLGWWLWNVVLQACWRMASAFIAGAYT